MALQFISIGNISVYDSIADSVWWSVTVTRGFTWAVGRCVMLHVFGRARSRVESVPLRTWPTVATSLIPVPLSSSRTNVSERLAMSCSNPQDSATASPKAMRSSSISERRPFAPVTPQRTNRGHKSRVVSSPLTPSNSSIMSSPFTPITNVYSSASSITSPDSSVSTKVGFSPESVKSKSKSVADATHNWRSRAKENGIKVDNDDYPFSKWQKACLGWGHTWLMLNFSWSNES